MDRLIIWIVRRTRYVQALEKAIDISKNTLQCYISGNMDGKEARNTLSYLEGLYVRYSSKATRH